MLFVVARAWERGRRLLLGGHRVGQRGGGGGLSLIWVRKLLRRRSLPGRAGVPECLCVSLLPPPMACPISFAEVSSSRDSDLGMVGTNSTYPRIHVSTKC